MTAPSQPSRRRTLFRAVAVFAFWTLVGLASAVQSHMAAALEGSPVPIWTSILRSVPVWWFWALATPAVAWLGQRYRIERGTWPRSIPIHLAASVAATVLHSVWLVAIFHWSGITAGMTETTGEFLRILILSRLYLDILTYFAILGAAYAIDYHDRFRERELRASRLETQLAHARLDALRMQLNPHFLFNALNAVAAQVRAGRASAAVTMLGGLGDLLRYALDSDEEPLVPLWRELAFLDRYLDVERVRFADRLEIEVDVPPAVREARVPPLLLQPLVENAVRHGIAPRDAPGRIEVGARREDDRLVLAVRDDGIGLRGDGEGVRAARPGVPAADEGGPAAGAGEQPSAAVRGKGLGLANARRRLAELYGDRWRLEIRERPGGGVEVEVELPWSEDGG